MAPRRPRRDRGGQAVAGTSAEIGATATTGVLSGSPKEARSQALRFVRVAFFAVVFAGLADAFAVRFAVVDFETDSEPVPLG